MKIRLIEPRAPGLNVFDRARLPRLGLPLLGQLLVERGHDVRIYVETLAPVDWTDVAEADLVGFSSTTATTPAAYEMAGRVRGMSIPTVIGGSHVTFLPDEALQRVEDKTYGVCRVCSGEIGRPRLEAVPTATQCIDCKAKADESAKDQ